MRCCASTRGNFDDGGGTHAPAGAHRRHPDAPAAPAQFVNQRDEHPRERRGHRVAQRAAASAHVDAVRIASWYASVSRSVPFLAVPMGVRSSDTITASGIAGLQYQPGVRMLFSQFESASCKKGNHAHQR